MAGVWSWLSGFTALLVLYTLRQVWFLPVPAPVAQLQPGEFNAWKAHEHLREVASYGIRTVGTHANEVMAPMYFAGALESIRDSASEVGRGVKVEVETAQFSGGFSTSFLEGLTNTYANVTAVLARISWPDTDTRHAVLLNAHYDSALNTVAASDDAANSAVLIEVASALAHGEPLPYAVIVMVNGAEETNWQAAHGFVTQHRWASTCNALVNLEAAGAGGRELVVQTGPQHGWIAQLYAKHAPYPRGMILAQEIFQSGFVPGETDSRVLTAKGRMPGIDLINVDNGYVYHTSLDTVSHVLTSSLQRAGENTLALTRAMASTTDLVDGGDMKEHSVVFFDVLGHGMLVYSQATALAINAGAVVLVILMVTMRGAWSRGVLPYLLWHVVQLVLALLANAVVAVVLTALQRPMSWYSHPVLLYGIYGVNAVHVFLRLRLALRDDATSRAHAMGSLVSPDDKPFLSALLVWAVALAWFTSRGMGSAYIWLLWVVPPGLARLVIWFQGFAPGSTAFMLTHFIGVALPAAVWLDYLFTILDFFAPLMGRIGTELAPDLFIGAVITFVLWIITLVPLSVVSLAPSDSAKHRATAIVSRVLLTVFTISCAAALLVSPWSDTRPKRIFSQHTSRVFHYKNGTEHRDAGVWLNGMDNTRLELLRGLDVPGFQAVHEAPTGPFYGDFPWYFPIKDMVQHGWYIPAPPPVVPNRAHELVFSMVSEFTSPSGLRRMEFEMRGSDHLTVFLDPPGDAKITSWSFTDDALQVPFTGSTTGYYVFHASGGVTPPPWRFWIEYQTAKQNNNKKNENEKEKEEEEEEEPFRVAAYAHYLAHMTPETQAMHNKIPAYVDDHHWVSRWEGFEF